MASKTFGDLRVGDMLVDIENGQPQVIILVLDVNTSIYDLDFTMLVFDNYNQPFTRMWYNRRATAVLPAYFELHQL